MILYGTNPIAWSNDDDWSLSDHLSLDDCLSDCRKIGFDGIEGHKMPDDGTALKAALGAYGLQLRGGLAFDEHPSSTTSTPKAALAAWIDFTRAAGGDHINACECSNTVHGNDAVPVNDRPILSDAGGSGSRPATRRCRASPPSGGEDGLSPPHGDDRQVGGRHRPLHGDGGAVHAALARHRALHLRRADPAEVAAKYMDRVTHIHAKNVRPEIARQVREGEPSFLGACGAAPSRRATRRCVAFEPVLRIAAGARLFRVAGHRGGAGQRRARALPLSGHGAEGAQGDGGRPGSTARATACAARS